MGSGTFAHGQVYVALSRCTTLGGLYLKQELKMDDVIVDSAVVNFMENVQIISAQSTNS